MPIRTRSEPQDPRRRGRRFDVAGIEDAQARWGVIQSRGRVKGIIALVIVVAIVVAIALLAKSNAGMVLIGVILAAIAVGAIVVAVGKNKTGLSITPEWKPETSRDTYDDFDEDRADQAETPDVDRAASVDADDAADPVRRLDAQILGADLSKLGQVVSPKLAKSYAVGTLVLEGSDIVWEPGAASRAIGIENLSTAPQQVSVVEAAPLWGSWGLLRVATAGGDEWCMRVPGSVDLSPAFADLGLTLRRSS